MSPDPQIFLPKWIAWEVTRRCNLNCVHCRCSADMDAAEGDFTTAEAFRLIDDICQVAKPVLVLSGGEPLLRDDIFRIARYGTEQGLRMCLATNGTLLDDAVCRNLIDSGIRMVSLSLDGSRAEGHDDFRQCPGAFDATIAAAHTLRRNGIKFLINSSFTRRNQTDIAATFRLAKELGAVAWYLFMIVPTGRGEEILDELISPEDYEEILAWHFHQERQEMDILMRPTCAPHYYRIAPQLARAAGISYERRSLSFSTGGGKGCLAGQSICLIDAFGNLKPCSYFPTVAGNVKQTPFKDLWFHAPLLQELRDFSLYRGKCGVCEYLRVCGGCRARADAVHGDYLAEEPFCNYQPPALVDGKS
ncbi:MAG: radical SAM protein [Syntrophotaleaceae bacterium]